MRGVFFVFLLLISSLSIYAQGLPETQVKNVTNGKNVSFSNIPVKGRVTLISFWATWCVPCKKEIKNINLKMPDLKNEIDFDYVVVSVDKSEAEGLVRSYGLSQGWKFASYMDSNSDLMRSLNFRNVPYTIIIDKEGKIAYNHSGYEEGTEIEVFAKIKELLLLKEEVKK